MHINLKVRPMDENRTYRIAVASGKGGTGKTLVATNLADMWSVDRELLLVDLDVEEPNDALFLSVVPEPAQTQFKMIPEWNSDSCTLCDICTEVCNFNAIARMGEYIIVFEELCHSCYACSGLCPTDALPMKPRRMGEFQTAKREQLYFIEGRLDIGQEQAVPMIRKVIQTVDKRQDIPDLQLFDCPPGTSCPVVNAVHTADLVILVTEPTAFGLNDLQLAVETMRSMNKEMGVVINRDGIGDDAVQRWCDASGIEVIATIPYDSQLAYAYAKGKLSWKTNSRLREALEEIIAYASEKMKTHV
ncbi:MAG: ATP-binding protein [Bacteroidales bacterium]|jgi:MinD superfamily P-loop ATPase|nr:ATP-binding protein [Bacteroidales bacterium]MDD3701806.1 ATP-binding protein [Bacteroidales bacterium]MDY0369748.1 ATP-binding protein [Bacteroidales bacterium]